MPFDLESLVRVYENAYRRCAAIAAKRKVTPQEDAEHSAALVVAHAAFEQIAHAPIEDATDGVVLADFIRCRFEDALEENTLPAPELAALMHRLAGLLCSAKTDEVPIRGIGPRTRTGDHMQLLGEASQPESPTPAASVPVKPVRPMLAGIR
jgi:hypothetical protein